MELLRRALLVGCLLSGLWLLRLAPLDPLVTIAPHDFAAQQRREAAATPDPQKTEAERRRAEIPLPVYVEEFLQYNVFSATGPEWESFLRDVDARAARGATTSGLFMRPETPPLPDVADKLAAGGGITFVSMSRPGGDVHYQVVRHRWTRADFQPWRGFVGRPVPPAPLLYPFRAIGMAAALAGILFFFLLPAAGGRRSLRRFESVMLALGALLFAAPLVLVGGSVQALTRGLWVTVPCWILAGLAIHLFAAPRRSAPAMGSDPTGSDPIGSDPSTQFLRTGAAFLLMAIGPVVLLVWGSLILWNR